MQRKAKLERKPKVKRTPTKRQPSIMSASSAPVQRAGALGDVLATIVAKRQRTLTPPIERLRVVRA